MMGALLLVALPASFYTAVHWVALASWTHLWSLLILGAAPWCFLLALEGEPQPAPVPAVQYAFRTHYGLPSVPFGRVSVDVCVTIVAMIIMASMRSSVVR